MDLEPLTSIPVTELAQVVVPKQGNIIQQFAGRYMPLIILSSAMISSCWNANFKGATFLTTAIVWQAIASYIMSFLIDDKPILAKPSYCSIEGFPKFPTSNKRMGDTLKSNTHSILMGYTCGWIVMCLAMVWDVVEVGKKMGVVILTATCLLLNFGSRSNIFGTGCISWKKWLITFFLGLTGSVIMFMVLSAAPIFPSYKRQHMFFNFGHEEGGGSGKDPAYYCTYQKS
jgi:hypothetical protein